MLGMLAVLGESSLVSWPMLLWFVWWWSEQMEIRPLLWLGVGLGIVIDILMVRNVGVSSLAMVGFLVGLELIRQNLAEIKWVEWVYVFIFALGVTYMWGYWHSVGGGVVIGGITLLIMGLKGIGMGGEVIRVSRK